MRQLLFRKHVLTSLGIAACLLAFSPLPAHAQDIWKVEGKLHGKIKDGDVKKSEDISGIACDRSSGFPRLCLVVDDETQGAQIVILNDGELTAGKFIRLTKAQFDGESVELDAEGVAYDGGSFYVVGSHGRARHKDEDPGKDTESNAKAQVTRQIFRITLDASDVDMKTGELVDQPNIKRSRDLANALERQSDLSSSFDRPLKKNGMTIEGIAIRNGRLYVGMRGPVLGSDAVVASLPLAAVFDGDQTSPVLHRLALGRDSLGDPRGVRDITRYADGFLILAGPQHDPPKGHDIDPADYSIYAWDGANQLKFKDHVPSFGKKVKPEALLPLDDDARRVLLLFDGPKEGAPRAIKLN